MLSSGTATMLRVVPVGKGFSKPMLLRGATAASIALAGPKSQVGKSSEMPKHASSVHRPVSSHTNVRCFSSSVFGLRASSPIAATIRTTPSSRRAASTAGAAGHKNGRNNEGGKEADEDKPMDWNTFFRLRKQRRRWQLAFSTVACLGGGTAGAVFLGTGALDPLVSQLPLDPFITLGILTFGFAALGWLLGPVIGTGIFNMMNRGIKRQFTKKETEFFARIKKNRVDPSSASASNPVPDFYGEKIQSVVGYRQWLKDQRAFRKKRTTFI